MDVLEITHNLCHENGKSNPAGTYFDASFMFNLTYYLAGHGVLKNKIHNRK